MSDFHENGTDYDGPEMFRDRPRSSSQSIENRFWEEEDKGLETTLEQERISKLMSRFRTTRELSQNPAPPTSFYVERLVPKGALILLTGAPKGGGKTTALCHAISAIVKGEEFIGLETERTKVVYLTEQGRSFETEYLEPLGLMDRDDFTVLYSYETSEYRWTEVVNAAMRRCVENDAGILVIDTASHFARLQGDAENASGPVLETLRPLQEGSQRLGISIVLAHHDRKGGGNITESGRGSSAYSQGVDVIVNIRQPRGFQSNPRLRELEATGRYGDKLIGELMIELTADGYVSHGEKAQVATIKAEQAVLETLPSNESDALTASKLWELLKDEEGFGRTTMNNVLTALSEGGRIERNRLTTRGTPFAYWLPGTERSSSQNPIPMVGRKEPTLF